jgi:hypothetical protein
VGTLIGIFSANQQRERWFIKNSYSHRVAVFDIGIVVVEAAPVRDAAKAALKYSSLALHLIPVPVLHAKVTEHLAKLLFQLSPEPGEVDSKVAGIQMFTPERLAETFPGHVRSLSKEQIISAVLRRLPPPELTIKYRRDADGRETEIWLKLPVTHSTHEVHRIMSTLLGGRFREASTAQGLKALARGVLPFRGV